MQKIRDKKAEKFPVVKKPSIIDTLALIPHGKTARYTINDMPLTSVRPQVSILNKKAGRKEYEVTVYENGAVYDVRRN